MDTRATTGVTGLATMGRNLARNIARHGHTVAVHNRTTSRMIDREGTFHTNWAGDRTESALD